MPRTLVILSALALVVYLCAVVWLGALERGGPPHANVVLDSGMPGTLFLPQPSSGLEPFNDVPPRDARPPAVVLMHGFAGDRMMMSGLARRLARAGYAVLTPDVRGHGQNRVPFPRSRGRSDAFFADLSAAVDFLRRSPQVDGSRIAVMGHSMGASASLDFGTRDSGIDAVVLISGGRRLEGPYAPPNALFVYATGDPEGLRVRVDRIAARMAGLAGAEDLVRGETYGSVERGTGVRVVEIPGADHITVVYVDAAHREIVAWLDHVFGRSPGDSPEGGDARLRAAAIAGFAFVLLLPGLGGLVGRIAQPHAALPAEGGLKGLAAIALLLALAMPLLSVGAPAPILGSEVGDVIGSLFALAGVAALIALFLVRRSNFDGLARAPGAALAAAVVGSMAVYALVQPLGVVAHRLTLTPERTLVFALTALAFLPFELAFSLLLRRGAPARAVANAVLGRVVVLLALVTGVGVGVVPGVVTLMIPALAASFVLIEILAASVYATSRNLSAITLIAAVWLGLVIAATMPVRI